jgi:hypothetical protein
MAAKLIVYTNEADKRHSFITPEAYTSIMMDFRAYCGEIITNDSWPMRDIWQTTKMNYRAKEEFATAPKRLFAQ